MWRNWVLLPVLCASIEASAASQDVPQRRLWQKELLVFVAIAKNNPPRLIPPRPAASCPAPFRPAPCHAMTAFLKVTMEYYACKLYNMNIFCLRNARNVVSCDHTPFLLDNRHSRPTTPWKQGKNIRLSSFANLSTPPRPVPPMKSP